MRSGERSGCNCRPPLVAALGERGSGGAAAAFPRGRAVWGGRRGGVGGRHGSWTRPRPEGRAEQRGLQGWREGGAPCGSPRAAPGGTAGAAPPQPGAGAAPSLRQRRVGRGLRARPGPWGCTAPLFLVVLDAGGEGAGGRDNGLLSSYLRRPEGGGVLGSQTCLRLGAGRGHLSAFSPRPQTGAALPVAARVGCAAAAAALSVSAETHLNR